MNGLSRGKIPFTGERNDQLPLPLRRTFSDFSQADMSLQFLNTNDLGEGFCKQYGGSLKVRRGGTKW